MHICRQVETLYNVSSQILKFQFLPPTHKMILGDWTPYTYLQHFTTAQT